MRYEPEVKANPTRTDSQWLMTNKPNRARLIRLYVLRLSDYAAVRAYENELI